MKKFNFLVVMTASMAVSFSEFANAGGPTTFMSKTYHNDDGSYAVSTISKGRGGGAGPDGYYFTYYDKDGKVQSSTNNDFNYIKYDKNGEVVSEYNYNSGRVVYILDENDKVTGLKKSWGGDTAATFTYTETGKLLAYDANNNFVGAYEDIVDYHTMNRTTGGWWENSPSGYSNLVGNLSLVSDDGNFYDTDKDGRTVGVYTPSGDITKYSYDSGGNLISAQKNGESIYKRKIYTIEEADAATKKGNVNRVTITW